MHIQSTTISCWLYIQNISWVPPFHTTSTSTCLIWATILLPLAWILATAWYSRCHCAPLNSAVSEILLQSKSDHITSQNSLVTPDFTWIKSLLIVYKPFYTLHPSPITSPPHFFLSNLCSYTFLLWTPYQLVHLPIPFLIPISHCFLFAWLLPFLPSRLS